MVVVETDMCGVDAIQFLTGCTFGKGNLIHKDFGKMAFNFYDRNKDMGFRALLRPDLSGDLGSELRSLMRKVGDGTATQEEHKRLRNLRDDLQETYMNANLEKMFIITEPSFPVPKPAQILQSLTCGACGEMTMESRTRQFGEKPCACPVLKRRSKKPESY